MPDAQAVGQRRVLTDSREYSVSSTVSCNSAAARIEPVMPISARIVATATGWVM